MFFFLCWDKRNVCGTTVRVFFLCLPFLSIFALLREWTECLCGCQLKTTDGKTLTTKTWQTPNLQKHIKFLAPLSNISVCHTTHFTWIFVQIIMRAAENGMCAKPQTPATTTAKLGEFADCGDSDCHLLYVQYGFHFYRESHKEPNIQLECYIKIKFAHHTRAWGYIAYIPSLCVIEECVSIVRVLFEWVDSQLDTLYGGALCLQRKTICCTFSHLIFIIVIFDIGIRVDATQSNFEVQFPHDNGKSL